MKKLFVHLSILCLLAVLMVPMVGCNKAEDDMGVEDTPSTDAATATDTVEPMDTGMTTDMTTDMTTEPMGTDMSTPAQ